MASGGAAPDGISLRQLGCTQALQVVTWRLWNGPGCLGLARRFCKMRRARLVFAFAALGLLPVAAQAQVDLEWLRQGPPAISERARTLIDQNVLVVSATQVESKIPGLIALEVTLQNTSPKAITAYVAWAVARFPDGHERAIALESDLAANTAVSHVPGMFLPDPNSVFKPGGTQRIQRTIQLSKGEPTQPAVTAKVAAIVFEDRTAVGDPASLRHISASRAKEAVIYATGLREIKEAFAEADVTPELQPGQWPDKLRRLTAALERRIKAHQGASAPGGDDVVIASLLQPFLLPVATTRDFLDTVFASVVARETAWREGARLDVVE